MSRQTDRCFLDDLGVALSFYVPIQKPIYLEEDEYQREIDKLLIRQKAIADFLNMKISPNDFGGILRETDIDPAEYEQDVCERYRWTG